MITMLWHFSAAMVIGLILGWGVGFGYFAIVGVIQLMLYTPEGED